MFEIVCAGVSGGQLCLYFGLTWLRACMCIGGVVGVSPKQNLHYNAIMRQVQVLNLHYDAMVHFKIYTIIRCQILNS